VTHPAIKYVFIVFFIVSVALTASKGIFSAFIPVIFFLLFCWVWLKEEQEAARQMDLLMREAAENEEKKRKEDEAKAQKMNAFVSQSGSSISMAASDYKMPEKNMEPQIMKKAAPDSGEVIQFTRHNDERSFLDASKKNNLEMVMILLDTGVDINCTNANGVTPLMFAVKFGNYECAKFLIEKGADLERKSDKGLTALQIARETQNKEIESLIIAGGATS